MKVRVFGSNLALWITAMGLLCAAVLSSCAQSTQSSGFRSSSSSTTGTTTTTSTNSLITLLAGGSSSIGYQDATGTAAGMNQPSGLIVDASGANLYFADSGNHRIRKIVLSTKVVSTLAGSLQSGSTDGVGTAASFNSPQSVTTDGVNLYVADTGNNSIRKIVLASNTVTTFASSLHSPTGIATDGVNLYVTDSGSCKVLSINLSTQVVTTLAGSGSCTEADGTGILASLNVPASLVIDPSLSSLYVTDSAGNTVRKITLPGAVVTTVAGAGTAGDVDNATGTLATFNHPQGITTDLTASALYVAESGGNVVRSIALSGSNSVTTVVGVAGTCTSVNGTGTAATLCHPIGIASDGTSLYVSEGGNSNTSYANDIRKIVISSGVVSNFAGLIPQSGSSDAFGTSASMNWGTSISNVATDGTNVYFADTQNHTIRELQVDLGNVITLAGSAGISGTTDATGSLARFSSPSGVVYYNGYLYVTDTGNCSIRQISTSSAVVTTFAGSVGVCGSANGTGTGATFNAPTGIATDGTNLYVADANTHLIRKIVVGSQVVTTLAGSAGLSGTTNGIGSAARFNSPNSLVVVGTSLYVTDLGNQLIRTVNLSTAQVSTLAGTAGSCGEVDGTGTGAQFCGPQGIASDGSSNLYVTDVSAGTMRQVVISSGVVTTYAGLAWHRQDVSGYLTDPAYLAMPMSLLYLGGNFYIFDQTGIFWIH